MDPLSITASVVGLLAAAGKMTTIIRSAISAWREPPIVLLEADMEVGDFGRVLSTLRRYLVQVDEITPERRPLIALDDLIATFTDAVLTFSGLERVITEYQNTSVSIQPFVWAKCRESTAWHVRALQRQKSSLSLMLSIIQCESGLEAVRYQERLVDCLQKLIANPSLASRLNQLNDTLDARSSILPRQRSDADKELKVDVYEDIQTIRGELARKAVKAAHDGKIPSFSSRGELVYELSRSKLDEREKRLVDKNNISDPIFVMSTYRRNTVDLPTARIMHLGVEPVLLQSRVYRRCASNTECDRSFVSSLARTPWSIFSGFSLADISILSVVALPISAEETASFKNIIAASWGDDSDDIRPKDICHSEIEEIDLEQSRNPAELDSTVVLDLGNINCSSDSDGIDPDEAEYREVLIRRREHRRRRRITSGSSSKRTTSESIGSEDDERKELEDLGLKARLATLHPLTAGLTLSTAKEIEVVNVEARATVVVAMPHFAAQPAGMIERPTQITQEKHDQKAQPEEDSIEERVARILARVAELTGAVKVDA